MKKIISYAVVFAMGLTMMSCDDFLNDNRFPPTKILNTPEYWSNANNCQLQVDRYIDELSSGYGSGNSLGTFYFSTLSDDQVRYMPASPWLTLRPKLRNGVMIPVNFTLGFPDNPTTPPAHIMVTSTASKPIATSPKTI